MVKINLPYLRDNQMEIKTIEYPYSRPNHFPLVVWSKKLSRTKKQSLKLLCGLHNYPFRELSGLDAFQLDREMEQAWEQEQTKSILIIGDYMEFPPMKFKTRFGIHYSDYIYADVGNEGEADVGIGRVFGSIETIRRHLQMQIGDSNQAIVFDSDPNRASSTIEAVKALGFELQVLQRYDPVKDKPLLENAELILQVSDGVVNERIHGSSLKWASHSYTIMDYNDFQQLKFKNYPVIFSEACSTASFGPLLSAVLQAGAMYYGATSLSMNNPKEFSNWRACPYADGVKIGMLDVMDEVQTMGQVVQKINTELFKSLSASQKGQLQSALNNAKKGEDIPSSEVATILQYNLFGNPERPVTVGIDPDYDAGVIHYDT